MSTRLLTVLGCCGLLMVFSGEAAAASSYRVICNADVAVDKIDRKMLSDFFLGRKKVWADGRRMIPFVLPSASKVRIEFSEDVHRRSVVAVRNFWLRQVYSGRATPPRELPTDANIAATVAATPGAVGYVSSGQALPRGVQVLEITGID